MFQHIFRKVADVQKEKELIERQKNEPLDLPSDHPLRKLIWRFRKRSDRNLLSSPFSTNPGDVETGCHEEPMRVTSSVASAARTGYASDDETSAMLPVSSTSRNSFDISPVEITPTLITVKNRPSSVATKWARLGMMGNTSTANVATAATPVSGNQAFFRASNDSSAAGAGMFKPATVAAKPPVASRWKRLAGGDSSCADSKTAKSHQSAGDQNRITCENIVVTKAEVNFPMTPESSPMTNSDAIVTSNLDLHAELRIVTQQMNRVEERLDAIFKMFSTLVSGGESVLGHAATVDCAIGVSVQSRTDTTCSTPVRTTSKNTVGVSPKITSGRFFRKLSSTVAPDVASCTVVRHQSETSIPEVADVSSKPEAPAAEACGRFSCSPPTIVDVPRSRSSSSASQPHSLPGLVAEASAETKCDAAAAENRAFLSSPEILPLVAFPVAGSSGVGAVNLVRPVSDDFKPPTRRSASSERHKFCRKTSVIQLATIDIDSLHTSTPLPHEDRVSASPRPPTTNRRTVLDGPWVQPWTSDVLELDPKQPTVSSGANTPNKKENTPNKREQRTTLV